MLILITCEETQFPHRLQREEVGTGDRVAGDTAVCLGVGKASSPTTPTASLGRGSELQRISILDLSMRVTNCEFGKVIRFPMVSIFFHL